MSLVALVLNLTLGVLLMAALVLGWRLERRLKALRDSHEGFARAVEDLDRAAGRAEQGLADLRAATDEAADALAGRIEKARTLTARLDTLVERAASQAAATPEPAAAPSVAERRGRPLRDDLILEDAPRALRPPAEGRIAAVTLLRPAPPAPLFPAARSRARVDDDLFEDAPDTPARAAGAGR